MSFVVCDGCPNAENAQKVHGAAVWMSNTADDYVRDLSPFIDRAADIVRSQQDLPDDEVASMALLTDAAIDIGASIGSSLAELQELKAAARHVAEEGCKGRDGGRCPSADAMDAILRSMSEVKILPGEIKR
jgi:hypothetical protein